jgi:hypothetical protein
MCILLWGSSYYFYVIMCYYVLCIIMYYVCIIMYYNTMVIYLRYHKYIFLSSPSLSLAKFTFWSKTLWILLATHFVTYVFSQNIYFSKFLFLNSLLFFIYFNLQPAMKVLTAFCFL